MVSAIILPGHGRFIKVIESSSELLFSCIRWSLLSKSTWIFSFPRSCTLWSSVWKYFKKSAAEKKSDKSIHKYKNTLDLSDHVSRELNQQYHIIYTQEFHFLPPLTISPPVLLELWKGGENMVPIMQWALPSSQTYKRTKTYIHIILKHFN